MKRLAYLTVTLLFALLFGTMFLSPTASAKAPDYTVPEKLIQAVATQLDLDANPDALYQAGLITNNERVFFAQHHVVTFAVAWRVALPAFGIYPYPTTCFPNIPSHPECQGQYADARATAIYYGFASPKTHPNVPMSNTDLDRLLEKLHKNTTPDPNFTCPLTESIPSWTLNTYKGRNAMLIAYDNIPETWLSDYTANGWRFSYQLPERVSTNSTHKLIVNYHTAGLTSFQDQCIYLGDCVPQLTFHELTHYAAGRLGWDAEYLQPLFNAEAASVSHILGAYAMTKSSEYFAEFVSYWLAYPDSRPALESAAPETTFLALQLIDNYDQLLYISTPFC